jgi:hypothetical protein
MEISANNRQISWPLKRPKKKVPQKADRRRWQQKVTCRSKRYQVFHIWGGLLYASAGLMERFTEKICKKSSQK